MIARPARIEESYESALRSEKWRRAKRMYALYLLFLVPLVILIIFRYVPIYGLSIAFVDYRYAKGMLGSPWNNFEHFRQLFANPYFARLFRNTVIISVLKLVFGFPAPIILALILNEVQSAAFKRTVQSISYLPHFLSWVVLSGIIIEMLSPQRGIVGYIYTLLGMEAPVILYSQGCSGRCWWSPPCGRASAGGRSSTLQPSPASIPSSTSRRPSTERIDCRWRCGSPCPRSSRSSSCCSS